MRRFWLVFSQAVTIALAILFVVNTLRPDLLPGGAGPLRADVVPVREAAATGDAVRGPSFADAAQRAMPAVVNIFTAKEVKRQRHPFMDDPVFRYFFGTEEAQTQRVPSLGSGVIVSTKGYIITNYHVINGATEIDVALPDGRKARAQVVGNDPETDLAILKLDLPDLPTIAFGDSRALRVGDVVLAIGNPLGVGQTVTYGIVSALGRHPRINVYEDFIQTDAAINPGNSGGALVDAAGNLVGINNAIFTQSGGNQGIGFAIPAATARDVLEQIVEKGSVTRGWVGIGLQDLTPELARSLNLGTVRGVLITEVVGGAPADKAGVRPGDVLVSVNDRPIASQSTALNTISALKPGDAATLNLQRGTTPLALKVTAASRPKPRS
ncbi:MAG: trypsin-like peptidase domain-containing protein [Burkholderiales bacterium]